MRHVPLARYDTHVPIAIQVRQGERVRLRPAIVNQMLDPSPIARCIFLLLVPKDSVIVAQGGDEVRQSVAVHVQRVNEPRCAQIEFRMKNPLAGAGIGRRFKPSLGRDDIGSPVAVHVACPDAVAVALGADDVRDPGGIASFARQLVPGQGESSGRRTEARVVAACRC